MTDDTVPPDAGSVTVMNIHEYFCKQDPRYRELFMHVQLIPESEQAMYDELRNAMVFDRHQIIEHQIAFLRDVLSLMPPLKRRERSPHLTAARYSAKL